MASTYQRLSGGRLLLNLVTGAEPSELARFGDFADKDTRYERTGEFIAVMRGAWAGRPTRPRRAPTTGWKAPRRGSRPDPVPPVYFGGASAAAEQVAAAQADVYLAWGEPPAMVAERIERVGALAAPGRADARLRHPLPRDHPTHRRRGVGGGRPACWPAWTPPRSRPRRPTSTRTQSEGQRRMASLHADGDGRLEIHPNVWAGIGLVRGGAGTALVGSHEEVADRIAEYHAVGFDEFILSGYPHLEEAYWFGEGVLPILRARGLVAEPAGRSAAAPVSTFR